jgi:hypothetical protein
VEQEQLTVPEHLCLRPVFGGFRSTGFNYPFGIFEFFLALVVSSMYNSLIPWSKEKRQKNKQQSTKDHTEN